MVLYVAVGYLAVSLAAFLFAFTHSVHMFQLNAYKAVFQKEWVHANRATLLPKAFLPVLSAVLFLFGIPGMIAGMAVNLAYLLLHKPKKAKKPLVYTTRVKRQYVTAVVLYLILAALTLLCVAQGVPLALVNLLLIFPPYLILLVSLINGPVENMVRRHYIREAEEKIASLPRLTVIGITGSYGKTSTKYYLEKILSQKYHVLMTPASYNTTMGVVKVVREQLTAAHDIFICEMGARNVGEIKEICDIVKPKYGIITSIGPCHLETFGSIEYVLRTKFELCDALPDDGIIFLNADNPHIAGNSVSKKAVYYGLTSEKASCTASAITVSEYGSRFTASVDGHELDLSVRLLGEHNIQNVLGCIAVAKALGVDDADIMIGCSRLESAPHRLSLIRGGDRFVIIDDSFNSNPGGAEAALKVLAGFEGEKIIITPGMIELGEKQDELNEELGRKAARVCDRIFLVGEKQTKPIARGVRAEGFDEACLCVFARVEDAINAAKISGGDKRAVILIENDLPDNF